MSTTTTKGARRLPMALAACGLAGVCVAPSAIAAPPDPIEVTYRFISGGNDPANLVFPRLCSFDVAITIEGKTKTIELPDGTVITTAPGQTATVTNLATGETLDFKISGTSQSTPTGVVFRGANLIIRSAAFGDDTQALLSAHGLYTFDTTATPKFTGVGALTDVCAALA